MANRAYLINSTFRTSDRDELRYLREHGHVDGIVAERLNRLPIPWFLCFRKSDLMSVRGEFRGLRLPSTSVEQALRNLEQALPVFKAIAGDADIAREYWARFSERLQHLPLPYLALEPTEVLRMDTRLFDELPHALSGDAAAIPSLKILSRFRDKVAPYPLDVLCAVPDIELDRKRLWNSSVLDGGIQSDIERIRWNMSEGVSVSAVPPPHHPVTVPSIARA